MAQNAEFKAGLAYVPVQRFVNGVEESHLYEISASSTEVKHIAGPITGPDGSSDVTIFGSALSSKCILYMYAFDRNSVIACDLTKLPPTSSKLICSLKIGDLPSPNDVALDPTNEHACWSGSCQMHTLGVATI